MSIPFSGCRSRSAGLVSAIAKQYKLMNFQPVKKIVAQFDPFSENVTEMRKFLVFLNSSKLTLTNPQYTIKTNILCDRSEPTITFNLDNGENLIIKTTNLSVLDLMKLCNKHITSLVPPDPAVLAAKEEKKQQLKRITKMPKFIKGSKKRPDLY